MDEHRYGIAVYDPDWHQGVIGIVAARLKEKILPAPLLYLLELMIAS